APAQGREPDPSWRILLTDVKRKSDDPEGALVEVDMLIKESPNTRELVFLRADILQQQGLHEAAIAGYEAFLKLMPDHAQSLNNMGVSLRELGRLADAGAAFMKAIEVRPNYAQAALNSGQLLSDIGQMEPAIGLLRRAHSLDPDNQVAEFALIEALQVGEQVDEAERMSEKLYQREPENVQAMVRLGNVRVVQGDKESALELARAAYAADPKANGVLPLMVEAGRSAEAEPLLAEIESLIEEQQEELRGSIDLHFSAARLCERLRRYEQALGHYLAGNAARREQLERLKKDYQRDKTKDLVDRRIASFGPEKIVGPGGGSSEMPVFIVGMPRSGTSLTEQILASHAEVVGGGELTQVPQIVRWLGIQHGFPEKLSESQVREAAKMYLTHVGRIGQGATCVTDKMPGNYNHIGLIARMFPKARIIHCRRDPMDNCLSCFAQNFRADGLGWSTDLEDLAYHYCQYHRLMDHWRGVLPAGRMLEIDYEDTVADLEGQARRIVDFVGLEWDDACLRFHETERAVVTASRSQVRQPIYNTSVGRWKRYGAGIAPLSEALKACGCGPK
ncbi:MAG: sulfotransferase, partial [Alphaproteobacteria bacterium]